MRIPTSRRHANGFTIVELLIVIVVIGILASITVVAYRNISDRADYARMNTDFSNIRKALELYRIDHGQYPDSSGCVTTPGEYNYQNGWCGWDQGKDDSFIPGLVPDYIASVPNQQPASLGQRDSYVYQSRNAAGTTGAGTAQYQLLRFKDTGLSGVEIDNAPLLGGDYGNLAWGFKSNPGGAWW